VNDDLAELHVYAGPDNPLEAAAISWLVDHAKEPQELGLEEGAVVAWAWWRQWQAHTRHTLPECLYGHLPAYHPRYSCTWYSSYQEAIAAFVAAYAAWQASGGENEPGEPVVP
jgi:hypothetical protein